MEIQFQQNNTWKKHWKTYLRERRYNLSIIGRNPAGDWRIILSLFFVALVVFGVHSFWVYQNMVAIINQDVVIPASRDNTALIERAEDILSTHRERMTEFNALLSR